MSQGRRDLGAGIFAAWDSARLYRSFKEGEIFRQPDQRGRYLRDSGAELCDLYLVDVYPGGKVKSASHYGIKRLEKLYHAGDRSFLLSYRIYHEADALFHA